jgi:hypothetical protein
VLPRREHGDARPDSHHITARFVPEHEGALHDEAADPSVLEVVHIRAADSDRADAYQNLAWPRFRSGSRGGM